MCLRRCAGSRQTPRFRRESSRCSARRGRCLGARHSWCRAHSCRLWGNRHTRMPWMLWPGRWRWSLRGQSPCGRDCRRFPISLSYIRNLWCRQRLSISVVRFSRYSPSERSLRPCRRLFPESRCHVRAESSHRPRHFRASGWGRGARRPGDTGLLPCPWAVRAATSIALHSGRNIGRGFARGLCSCRQALFWQTVRPHVWQTLRGPDAARLGPRQLWWFWPFLLCSFLGFCLLRLRQGRRISWVW